MLFLIIILIYTYLDIIIRYGEKYGRLYIGLLVLIIWVGRGCCELEKEELSENFKEKKEFLKMFIIKEKYSLYNMIICI